MTPSSLFGAPVNLTDAQWAWWVRTLTVAWRALMDREPGDLRTDLVDLAPLYGNGARPKAIRERLHRLPAVDSDTEELPGEIALILDGSSMITPEGRIYLAVLHEVPRTSEVVVTEELQLWALGVAASTRGDWYAQWVRKQFEGSLSASALGAAIFLLVNGSIGESRALVLPSDPAEDRRLGGTIIPLISRFSVALGGKEPEADSGIRQHWAFTQVSRLLGRDVAREKSPSGTITYVRPGREESLLAELSVRLERLSSPGRRHDAVEQLVSDYRTSRGALASVGVMHEDPTATRRIVERLTWPGFDL